MPGWPDARVVLPRLGRAADAFTLVEVLVSLAVIAVALAVVTTVFSITTRTASQAAAASEVHALMRNALRQIEADLRDCDPSTSLLVIVGRTQPAALTPEDLAAGRYWRVLTGDPARVPAGYDPAGEVDNAQYSHPRADLLMFFTNRPTASKAPPIQPPTNAYLGGEKFAPVQVVYGHAALAEPVRGASGQYTFPPDSQLRHIEQTLAPPPERRSRLPAVQWHLARRAVILEYPGSGRGGRPDPGARFDDDDMRRVVRCWADPSDPAEASSGGDIATFDLHRWLADPAYFGISTPPAITDAALLSPYEDNVPPGFSGNRRVYAPGSPRRRLIDGILYPNNPQAIQYRHVATVIENPPVELASNTGLHLLPGCVWFQVEFLMPEDPRPSPDYFDPSPGQPPGQNANRPGNRNRRDDMPRWTEVKPGETYVFVPDTPENRALVASQVCVPGAPQGLQCACGSLPEGTVCTGSRLATFATIIPPLGLSGLPGGDRNGPNNVENRRIRMWPWAVRITLRAYDRHKRLDEPITHSVVHRFD